MTSLTTLGDTVISFMPFLITLVVVLGLLWGAHRLLIARHADFGNDRLFPRQLIMLGLTFAGLLAITLALPIEESSRNQVIAIIGLIISGIFAFSSSTLFTNLMGGIMLRVTKPFRVGDFITTGGYFGRVVERGLLDTEIQTENRELVALPNIHMITHPISVIRSSGTIISTSLSLGYDIHHSVIEERLLLAATNCGLEEPFVQITALGDFSISYKVSGLLTEVKSLLTARSNLSRHVLDSLHEAQIEIVSPGFMNQRKLADDLKVIPVQIKQSLIMTEDPVESIAEDVVFDKAEQAEKVDIGKQSLIEKIEASEAQLGELSGEDKKRAQSQIDQYRKQLKAIDVEDIEAAAAVSERITP